MEIKNIKDIGPRFHPVKHVSLMIIIFVLGIVSGIFVDPYLPSPLSNFKTGFNSARNLAQQSSFGSMFRVPDDIRSLSGTVVAVNGNSLSVKTRSVDPFDNPINNNRIVTVTPNTKIIKTTLMDLKAYQDEMLKFAKDKNNKSAPAPNMVTESVINVSDIHTGDSFTVTSSNNIKTAKEFTAQEIQIQSGNPAK